MTWESSIYGLTENAGYEIARHENTGHEFTRHVKYRMKIDYITAATNCNRTVVNVAY